MSDTVSSQLLREAIQSSIADLQRMDYRQIYAWAKAHGCDDGPKFKAFKSELKRFGIDYDALRAKKQHSGSEGLRAKAKHSVTLYSDAKARTHRFGICDAWQTPVWYGKFFPGDGFNGEQSNGELVAAKKAVYLASKVREAIAAEAIVLNLYVDAQWLCNGNKFGTGEKAGKSARQVPDYGARLGVVVNLRWISGKENPADEWTVASGFLRYQQRPLKTLLDPRFVDWLNKP